MRRLATLFFLSGAAGLIYELLWLRILALVFGVTSYAISAVLAGFMAGLAIGSLLAGRFADRLKDPLRAYAAIEALIALTGLLTLPAFAGLQALYRAAHPYLSESPALLAGGRFSLALAIMVVPTSLMGATLPVMLRSSLLRSGHPGSHLGTLYALNTAGAIAGCLATPFLLIGTLGVRHSIFLAALLNLLAAFLAFRLAERLQPLRAPGVEGKRRSHKRRTSRPRASEGERPKDRPEAKASRIGSPTHPPTGPPTRPLVHSSTHPPTGASTHPPTGSPTRPHLHTSTRPHLHTLTPTPAETAYPTTVRGMALGVIALSGLVSLAYEVVWARLLATLFDATVYSFALMLATFLFGLAAGSAAVKPFLRRALSWPAVLAAIEALIGLGSLFSILFLTRFGWDPAVWGSWLPFLSWFLPDPDLRHAALVSFAALFPATFMMGASFPVAAQIYSAGLPDLGRRVGRIFAANVCGSIFGSLLAGFVLLPRLGSERSMQLLVAANCALALAMLAAAPGPPLRRLAWALPIGVLLGLAPLRVPSPYASLFASRFPDARVLWRQEGIENTVTVAEERGQAGEPSRRVLYLNGHHQANDSPGMVAYHRRIGHLPVLMHPNPRRALVIGLGGGVTPGAVAVHPGIEVECVELSASVVGSARHFAHVNHAVLRRPNVRLRVDDGRNHLLLRGGDYDVITADIILPRHAGSGNLYSEEYYRLCRRALAPGGLMCQWFWQASREQYQLMLRTFLRAFPYVTLWDNGGLVIGSNRPIVLSRAALEANFADPAARASLASAGIADVEALLALYRGNREEALRYVGTGPVVTDDRPRIEYFRSSAGLLDVNSGAQIHRDLIRTFESRPPVTGE